VSNILANHLKGMKKSVTVRRRHANKLSSRQVKKVGGGGADKLLVARPAQSTLCMLRFVSENFTPFLFAL